MNSLVSFWDVLRDFYPLVFLFLILIGLLWIKFLDSPSWNYKVPGTFKELTRFGPTKRELRQEAKRLVKQKREKK